MKRVMECINAVIALTDFPIYASSLSAYAEIMTDVPINRILYVIKSNESGSVVFNSGCHKDEDADRIQDYILKNTTDMLRNEIKEV
jgi:hypothetical protein